MRLLDELLRAQTERDVHACLSRANLLDDSHWRPYGGLENNGGQFLNQQASPRGALVEKIVNSVDAVLTAKAYEHGDLPGSPPETMFEAAERYFNVRDGRLAEITALERGRIARQSVQVVVSGKRSPGKPTVTITDQGEGQVPETFPQDIPVSCGEQQVSPSLRAGEIQHGIDRRGSVLWEGAQLPTDSLSPPSCCPGRQHPVGIHGRAPSPSDG